MRWRFHRSFLALAWGTLVVGLSLFVLGPWWDRATAVPTLPSNVPMGDQEIVWLNAATNTVAWERLVVAIRRLQDDPELGLQVVDDTNAFPVQTTATPELAITIHHSQARLWFRWYKLTGEMDTARWLRALEGRQPLPLAIIGGGNSDRAIDLATELKKASSRWENPPIFLITHATADQVVVDNVAQDLMRIYTERSFRFCFTNLQMSRAIADFIWKSDELRPDEDPIYLVYWNDDPYSVDLFDRFKETLSEPEFGPRLRRLETARSAASDWAWLAGHVALGGIPPGLDLEGLRRDEFQPLPFPFWWAKIEYSVGTFSRPNRCEAETAEKLMDEISQHPSQRRPLLIVPADPQPARRFLRALVRIAPIEAGRFVVATGDAIDFSTVYRDRRLTWPIQDLPFSLVLFSHRNPVDPIAFQVEPPNDPAAIPNPDGRNSTGSQTLLLYHDIVRTLVQAAFKDRRLLTSADALRDNLREARLPDGRLRFDALGNQVGGTGEYVVCVLPVRDGNRVLPRAVLQVWNRTTDAEGRRGWDRVLIADQPEILIDYTQPPATRVVEVP